MIFLFGLTTYAVPLHKCHSSIHKPIQDTLKDAKPMGDMPLPTPAYQPAGYGDNVGYSSNPTSVPSHLTLLHTNDIHAHLDEFNKGGTDCTEQDIKDNQCFGGMARIKSVVDQFRSNSSDVVLFDAGDIFQGTLFFNTYGGQPAAELMNDLKYDVMTIGNHEFDRGVDYLAEFYRNISFPIVSSNIDMETALPLKELVKPYIIIEKYNLGVIGFITNTTSYITSGARNITFMNPVGIVQSYVDELQAKGIKRIICVSHNGYNDDKYLASNTRGINLIVGGHSHSLLLKDLERENVVGPYPTNVTNLDGKQTWIVQVHRFGDYLGHLELEWDENDELKSLVGDPILLDQTIAQDATFQKKVDELRQGFKEMSQQVLTESTQDFDNSKCKKGGECPMGYLISDCMRQETDGTDVAFMNVGGIRAFFTKGNITTGEVLTVLPFDNTVSSFTWTGAQLKDFVERILNKEGFQGKRLVSPPIFSGLKVEYNDKAANGSRITKFQVGDKPLDMTKTYSMLSNSFILDGGDGMMDPSTTHSEGKDLAHVIMDCLKKEKTISPKHEMRVISK